MSKGVIIIGSPFCSEGLESEFSVGYISQANGFVEVDGTADVISTAYSYASSGVLNISGIADIRSSWIGTFYSKIGVITYSPSLEKKVVFNDINVISQPALAIKTNAGYSVAIQLELKHNLADNNVLADFLVRNQHVIPDSVFLLYHKHSDLWQSNLHYYSLDKIEEWRIRFMLNCKDSHNGEEVGEHLWKFNMSITRRMGGITTGTKFIAMFNVNNARVGVFTLPFSINTITEETSSDYGAIISDWCFFEDGIKLFANNHWKSFPELHFKISEVSIPPLHSNVAIFENSSRQKPIFGVKYYSNKIVDDLKPSPYEKVKRENRPNVGTYRSKSRPDHLNRIFNK